MGTVASPVPKAVGGMNVTTETVTNAAHEMAQFGTVGTAEEARPTTAAETDTGHMMTETVKVRTGDATTLDTVTTAARATVGTSIAARDSTDRLATTANHMIDSTVEKALDALTITDATSTEATVIDATTTETAAQAKTVGAETTAATVPRTGIGSTAADHLAGIAQAGTRDNPTPSQCAAALPGISLPTTNFVGPASMKQSQQPCIG